MRRAACVALISFFLIQSMSIILVPIGAEPGQDDFAVGIIINEILAHPRPGSEEMEYVLLYNAGSSKVDITGWRLCDSEDCFTIWNSTFLDPGGLASITKEEFIFQTGKGIDVPLLALEDMPRMANDGDFIWLENGTGHVVDVVSFGKAYQGDGWSGPSGPRPRNGYAQVRDFTNIKGERAFIDTNTASDWPMSRSRRPEFDWKAPWDLKAVAQVTALEFPEDVGVLAREVAQVENGLSINTYKLSSMPWVEIIRAVEERNVRVDILLEMSPVGGLSDKEVHLMGLLLKAGCNISVSSSIGSEGTRGAFRYNHAKYMILGDDRVVVMSENLVQSGNEQLGRGNRGWGVIVKNGEIRDHFYNIFRSDLTSAMDVGPILMDRLKEVEDMDLELDDPPIDLVEQSKERMFNGKAVIVPLLSPDFAEEMLIQIIDVAKDRILLELLSIELEWGHLGVTEMNPLLMALVRAARRGVEVKVLLDPNFLDTSDNDEVVRYLNELSSTEGLDLKARLAHIPDIEIIHNKGLVIDDTLIVSSINWGDTSFRENREVGLAITMDGPSDLYSSFFMADWEPEVSNMTSPIIGPEEESNSSVYQVCGVLLVFGAVVVLVLILAHWKKRT